VPTSKKVETPLKGIRMRITDPAEKLDNSDKWEPLYQQIIVKRAAK
jgi:iron(III) transport system substrate-binding protein